MKKVLHVLGSNKYSGAENVVCTIIDLFDGEYDMYYASPDGSVKDALKEKNINFKPLVKLNVKNLNKIIKDVKPDIIHAHDYRASIVSAFSCFRGKIISHIHKNDPSVKKLSFKSLSYMIACRKFEDIIVVSASVVDEAVFGKMVKSKSKILPNYVSKNNVLNLSMLYDVKEKYDLCFVGRFENEKNPAMFIEIVKSYKESRPGIKAVMIGDGSLMDECLSMIKVNNLENNIDVKGFLSNPYPYIKSSKLCIVPSLYEGFGLVAIEALILGKPALNSGTGGLSKIFEENNDYICYNIDDYIDKIKLNKFSDVTSIINKYADAFKYKNELAKFYR